ncbi:MAG: hypothetical protein K6G52_01930 [Treponemataceae bacterium]|nr:hypothetical protein [Treponemataceae bacterium]
MSCSDSSPLIGTVNATLVYNFENESSPYEQYLSVFIKAASDDRRVDKLKVSFPQSDYEWLIDTPEQVRSAKSIYFGATKLFCPDKEHFEGGTYTVSFLDLASRETEQNFEVKPLESMEDKNGKFVRARDVVSGKAGSECSLKRVILFDTDGNELYCGLYTFMFENKAELLENFPTAGSYQIYFINRDYSCAIFLPKQKI